MNERSWRRLGKIVFYLLVIALAVLIAVLAGCPRRRPAVVPTALAPTPVVTLKVVPNDRADLLVLPGRLAPQYEADLATVKAGLVAWLGADRGDAVRAGQVLLRLDDRVWRTHVDQAAVELREAEKELQRRQALEKTGAVSVSDLDGVRARYDLARAAASNAEVQLSQCVVTAPEDGLVEERYVEVGEHAGEGAPVFRLVNTEQIKVRVDLPEREVGRVRVGQELTFTVDALPGLMFTGRVEFIAAAASPENNAFRAELLSANPDGLLRPGMMASVRLMRAASRPVLVLPLTAVLPLRGEYVVFVVEQGRAARRNVKLEEIRDNEVVVAEGLRGGEDVVVEGNRTLAEGEPVETRPAE